MEKRKITLISLGIIVILLVLISGVYFRYKFAAKVVSPLTEIQPTSTPAEESATWDDQAEFSFQYPKSLSLNPHPEDQENYAHVELTSATHSGSLVVWTKDTTAENIDDWAKQTKTQNAIDSTLGGEPAKKISTNEENKKLTTTVIRNGYLYQIEVILADLPDRQAGFDFWNKVYETVSSSFKFTSSQDKQREDIQNEVEQEIGGEEVIEEEEIIE